MRCTNCGATVSDTANYCTQCGARITRDTERDTFPPRNQEGQPNGNVDTSIPTGRKRRPRKWVYSLIGIACVALYLMARYDIPPFNEREVQSYIPPSNERKARPDIPPSSGREVQPHMTKGYVSQDLRLFDLKGDVKSCGQTQSLGIMEELTLTFDESGTLTSIRNKRPYREHEGDGVYYGIARDNDGRIVQFHQVGVLDLGDEINITYNEEDWSIARERGNYMVAPFEIIYNYENGKLKNAILETYYEDGDHLKITSTFSFENVDGYGNWLTCKRHSRTSSYNSITGEIYDETQGNITITREITYYSQESESQDDGGMGYGTATRQGDPEIGKGKSIDMESFYRKNFSKIKELLEKYGSKHKTKYALKDLDGDGSDEFFITDNDAWYTSVFTVKNGNIKFVTGEGGINSVYGRLLTYSTPSTWGAVIYCVLDDGNIFEGLVGTTMEGDRFFLNDKECTREEFERYFSRYKGEEEPLEWKPLSGFIEDME